MTQTGSKHKSLRSPSSFARPDLGAWNVNEVETEVMRRIQEVQRLTNIEASLRQKVAEVVRYGLGGLDFCGRAPQPRALGDVARACGSPTHRDDVVASLLDAARARLALTYVGELSVTSRQIAALACRSRPGVQRVLGSSVGRGAAEAFLAACPDALAPWGSEESRARRRAERAEVRAVAAALDAGDAPPGPQEAQQGEEGLGGDDGPPEAAEAPPGPAEALRRPVVAARRPEAWPAFPPPPVAAPALPGPPPRDGAPSRRVLHVGGAVRILEMRDGAWQEVSL